MIPENKMYKKSCKLPLEFPDKVAKLPIAEPKIQEMTLVEVRHPITYVLPDE